MVLSFEETFEIDGGRGFGSALNYGAAGAATGAGVGGLVGAGIGFFAAGVGAVPGGTAGVLVGGGIGAIGGFVYGMFWG